MILMGLAAAAAAGVLFFVAKQTSKGTAKDTGSKKGGSVTKDKSLDTSTVKTSNKSNTKSTKITGSMEEKELHAKIEELDKKGKAFFKNKQFMEAAQAFSEALTIIEENTDQSNPSASTSLNRQIVTLINNRSAMYEKGNVPELALDDCKKILEVYDMGHMKARTRKLRILEGFHSYYEGLVEACALQLLYMQQNRDQLRMGLPPKTQPPISQNKLEELLAKVLPDQLEELQKTMGTKNKDSLPSDYTLMQLLKSYTGYNSWMAKAARDGSIEKLQKELDALPTGSDPTNVADRASTMMKMGRRCVYDSQFAKARSTLLEAYDMVKGEPDVQKVMKDDDYPRLLEWVGMVKHWTYDLDGASACYQQCADLEPINAEVLVKKAGVAMDGGKHDEALKLFENALAMDPDAVDALLHRANLRMLQANLIEAEADLEKCVRLRPNHVLAHLRLAAVLTSKNDPLGAKKHLQKAEQVDPDSSEVQSYRGELLFTQNNFAEAKKQFEKAIKLEPKNPTPYVNAALAVLNTPPQPGKQMEIAVEAVRLLEKAIEVDPQFQAAYVQLGQLKLGMAQDLESAREVLKMYEQGLSYCRTKEEMKDLCGMKILTQAQVDAATNLKMETFSMQ